MSSHTDSTLEGSAAEPSCSACSHFASLHGDQRIVQISVGGRNDEEPSVCAHPAHRPLRLRVRPDESCSSFDPGRRAG